MVRFGEYEFQPSTGDLRRVSPPPPGPAVRLAPQPAKLLELLIECRGELLERDEIRRALWPDTHVDFDQSLAFCMRQLRAALGDSGTAPTYIETLPRRGFRLVAPLLLPAGDEPFPPADPAPASPPPAAPDPRAAPALQPVPPRRPHGVRWIAGTAVILAAAIAALLLAPTPREPPRLAIMPFELAAGDADSDDRSRLAHISEWLVAELARDTGARIEVIGPRTTASYHGTPFPDLDALDRELEVDYVLNSRYLEDTPAARAARTRDGGAPEDLPDGALLVELIRLEDRAHPWVERFDGPQPWLDIARTVRDGVRQAIDRTP